MQSASLSDARALERHRLLWRWHFYAGLFVMPLLLVLAITGTLGYEVNYIRSFPTPTGRKIRIVTNRAIRFGEAWADSRSMDYSLSALELDITKEKGKSTGILLPACQFKLDKENHLEIENYQNPWKLTNILNR